MFTEVRNLKRHQRIIHEKSVMFSCTECSHTTTRKRNLHRHMKRHAKATLSPNLLPKAACRDPDVIDPPTNDPFLEHHSMLDRNSQRGFGVTPTDVQDEIRQFFQEEQPWGTDQNLHQVYVQDFHRIRDTKSSPFP